MAEGPQLSAEEKQAKWLEEAHREVKKAAALMNQAMQQGALQDVLKHASGMLVELRTSQLSPQNYYELFTKVHAEMLGLEGYFRDEVSGGRRPEDLYEIVQHAGNIIPRLYLLITVGAVWIKTKEVPAKDILKDLVEMCKGVQHPTRGLFLRYFLANMTKNTLPDTGNQYETDEGGNVMDSLEFVLQNFKEMVWLWVRMEQKQIVADAEQRSKERRALGLLIGYNITQLSSLDGIDLDLYKESVMPNVIEIIANSKDTVAQQYLMEIMIQVFPDEFHLVKIENLLKAICEQLMDKVNLQSILSSLMDRLGNYALDLQQGGGSGEKRKWESKAIKGMFELFTRYIEEVAQKPKAFTPEQLVSVQLSLLTMVLKAYPSKHEWINRVFSATATHLEQMQEQGAELQGKAVRLLATMLLKPVDHFGTMVSALDLDDWPRVLGVLPFQQKREVARNLILAALRSGEPLSTVEHVDKVFSFIQPLVSDSTDESVDPQDEGFKDDMELVAKLVHLFRAPDDEYQVQFKILSVVRKQFGLGGEHRGGFTLAPLTLALLKLGLRVKKALDQEIEVGKVKLSKIFEYVGTILIVLSRSHPRQALSLYLQAARTADKCEQTEKCDELLRAAFTLYEEVVMGDSRWQMQYLPAMVGCVQTLKNLEPENYDGLAQKLASYPAQFLNKPDQCRIAVLCSHLFWRPGREDLHKKVLDCLQRSLKIVDGCTPEQQSPLFVEILNKYLYFFAKANEHVTVKHINVLIQLINENISKQDEPAQPGAAPASTFYQNTIAHIEASKEYAEDGERWCEIKTSL
eukprot:TRINITY_DN2314_c0_g1_i1.p1 TRINITY_DN2314_c0_g1~~TRINITY_DN2314_c0_g1_i1.p1  ORF type:complete len:839 (+),score=380.55 TRINITY_DN2314_c0_g1_i1:114-2519(+)